VIRFRQLGWDIVHFGRLYYWRDDASHGAQTTIQEVEAYAAIGELLRLAQFTSDHWDDLAT